jgi:aminoglycoside phosphotransferase (APT) family kinase protein
MPLNERNSVPMVRMHTDEVSTDEPLVRRLLAAQFPQWALLELSVVKTTGTDHAIYRLGAELCVRLPRIDWAIGQADKEGQWLPKLAPGLPLKVPVQLAKGVAGKGYPWQWSVCRWIEGEAATPDGINDLNQAARELAGFIQALQAIDAVGGPSASDLGLRGAPLATRDAVTREAILRLDGRFDTKSAMQVWDAALAAPEWDRDPVWFHGDLPPGNLLVNKGRLAAVIDFGGLGVGDPACDLMAAWSLFSGESRHAFRQALGTDDATWTRGRGHALSQAAIFIPYYLQSHPVGIAAATRQIDAVLSECQESESGGTTLMPSFEPKTPGVPVSPIKQ